MRRQQLEQQAKHCTQLADFLETLNPQHYNHKYYGAPDTCGTVGCALGWAGVIHVGGMDAKLGLFDKITPILPGTDLRPVEIADKVFGEDAYRQIFDTTRHMHHAGMRHYASTPDRGRRDSINLLRQRAEQLRREAALFPRDIPDSLMAEGDRHRSTFIA